MPPACSTCSRQLPVRGRRGRIIQDRRACEPPPFAQASAWDEWSALNDAFLFQATLRITTPHACRIGRRIPGSWAPRQMMKFYVKGGAHSHGQHGYIVSNANWDPYPMANKLENFIIGIANMDVAVMLRIDRFSSPFSSVVKATDVLPAAAAILPATRRLHSNRNPGLTNRWPLLAVQSSARWRICRHRTDQVPAARASCRHHPGSDWRTIFSKRACGSTCARPQNALRDLAGANRSLERLARESAVIAYSAGSAAGSDATVAARCARHRSRTFYPTALRFRGAESMEPPLGILALEFT